MNKWASKRKGKSGLAGLLTTFVLFAVILAMLLNGTFGLSQSAKEEGVNATRRAIERAVILCYATEGFYPPGLSYIESRYGVRVDTARYAVRYEVYAANVMPVIKVVAR